MEAHNTLKILVMGGFGDGANQEEMTAFGRALGEEIVSQGHLPGARWDDRRRTEPTALTSGMHEERAPRTVQGFRNP